MSWRDVLSCGCGGSEPDEEEVERIIREVEEEREGEPLVLPIETEEPIEAPEIFQPVRRLVEVE